MQFLLSMYRLRVTPYHTADIVDALRGVQVFYGKSFLKDPSVSNLQHSTYTVVDISRFL